MAMTCVFLSFCLEGELIFFSGLLSYKAVRWEVCCNLETLRRWLPIPTYDLRLWKQAETAKVHGQIIA